MWEVIAELHAEVRYSGHQNSRFGVEMSNMTKQGRVSYYIEGRVAEQGLVIVCDGSFSRSVDKSIDDWSTEGIGGLDD